MVVIGNLKSVSRLVLIVANSDFTCVESYSTENKDLARHCFVMKLPLV